MSEVNKPNSDDSILGLSTNELAGLSVDDITNNKTAIKMMMHYYKKMVEENNSLKNDNNTYRTYLDAYNGIKSNSSTGSILLAISNVSVGFGTNLLTNGNIIPGIFTIIPGIILICFGIYFTFFKERK